VDQAAGHAAMGELPAVDVFIAGSPRVDPDHDEESLHQEPFEFSGLGRDGHSRQMPTKRLPHVRVASCSPLRGKGIEQLVNRHASTLADMRPVE
jgi:hypothetical protein